jgi:hypothetical protein
MKLTSQMPSSTSLTPTAWPARDLLRLIFLRLEAESAATGDEHGSVVERVMRLRNAGIGAGRSGVDVSGALHPQSLMRAFGIELFNEGIEFSLLLKDVASGGACGFFLQSKMHTLVPEFCWG